MLTHDQQAQVHHIACMAVLAMCARGVAGTEFSENSEVGAVRITVTRSDGSEHDVDVEFVTASGIPLGGLAL